MTIFRLVTSALFPVLFAIIFYFLEKKTKFAKLSYSLQQIIIGVVFGGIACLATQFGIPTQDVVLNVRGAAPLSAGLLFGGPAGILAGIIGGVYRFVSVNWGIGSYSVIACSLGTILAGFIGAACRKFMFDNKKTSWFYGLFIGMSTEVLHMLLVFVTHMDDIEKAFHVVKVCAVPMILFNGISVMCAVGFVTLMGKEKTEVRNKKRQITQTFTVPLFISVIIAFVITSTFTFTLQNSISHDDAEKLLSMTIKDVENDIIDASNQNLLDITRSITAEIMEQRIDTSVSQSTPEEKRNLLRTSLNDMMTRYNVTEINIINQNGIITLSTNPAFDSFDMGAKEDGQAKDFLCLLDSESTYVQEYGPTDYDQSIMRKYAGIRLRSGGFVQVGYDADHFTKSIRNEVRLAAQNRHINENGYVFIVNESNFDVVSTTEKAITNEAIQKFQDLITNTQDGKITETTTSTGDGLFCMQERAEGFIIIGCIPQADAHLYRDLSVYINVFMQIVVFVTLFVLIYLLIKRIIVDNIHKINGSLAKIVSGDLNTTVDVRDNEEFSNLSDDINSTVDTLKHYIKEAESRVDKELEFAKTIQYSALPSVFPPFPNRKDFDIFASMTTAKEVGGDFYDFYFVGENKLVFLVADVSGKGIPAAMFMMTAKTMLKSLAETGLPLEEVMTQANQKLCEMNKAGMFVTVWIGLVDFSTGKLNYVSAGHNPPLLKRGNGEFEYLRGRSGLVLAGMEGIKYRKNEIDLMPGDKLYLYTDGVTEATDKNNKLYGEDRLLGYLNSQKNLEVTATCDGVIDDVNRFVGDAPQFDDITMLMFSLNEINAYNALTLEPNVESIGRVTDFVEGWMLKTKIEPKIIKKVNVIIDEIYSNVVHYSGASWAKVHYTRDLDNLYLTFTDDGKEYNPLEAEAPDITLSAEEREIGGLGILMVKKMASQIDYQYIDNQNTLRITISAK